MAYEPFDVVVVPFPYADRLAEKRRPAIVISNPNLEKQYNLTWLAMVTSAENQPWSCDVEISGLKSAGLPSPSRIRPAKIATADTSRIIRRIGKLSAKDADVLKQKLRACFPV
jgi:mRNA interferase MazF